MSAPRQYRQTGKLRFCASLAIRVLVMVAAGSVGTAVADPVVTDPRTGVAISGFDPVSYFAVRRPEQGKPEFEYAASGIVWYFRNIGNRAAFIDRPDIYGPQFGGYDPVAVARGALVPGHPLIWAVDGDRLYLFFDAKARAEFVANPGSFVERARLHWPDVQRALP